MPVTTMMYCDICHLTNIHERIKVTDDIVEWKCKICNCNLKECEYHLDHIIPLSKWWLHTILNVQRLCQKCNIVKQDKIYPLTFH